MQDVRVFLQVPPTISVGGQITNEQYQYTLRSPDTKDLYAEAPKLESEMRKLSQVQDVSSDLQVHNPQLTVQVDGDKAYALGLTAEQVSDALYSAYGQRQVSIMYTPSNEYYVILELAPAYENTPHHSRCCTFTPPMASWCRSIRSRGWCPMWARSPSTIAASCPR